MADDAPLRQEYRGLQQSRPTLERDSYLGPEAFARDLDAVWYRKWIYVCHGNTLKEPLSFKTITIGDQSVIVLRDDKGELRAFHNTCRHRGARICLEHQGKLKAKSLLCPYHQWTYGLDGALRRVTSRWTPSDFEKAQYSLFPVHLRQWRGLVFVSLAEGEPPAFEASFGRDPGRLDAWPLEDLTPYCGFRKVLQCNWKLFWENFNECLHCPNVHPGLSERVPIFGRRIMTPLDAHDWERHAQDPDPKYRGGIASGAEAWSGDGSALPVTFATLSEAERRQGHYYVTSLPSSYIAGHLDNMRIVRLLPISASETELIAEWFLPPGAAERSDIDFRGHVAFATTVLEEDAWACAINQQGLAARPYRRGVLMPEEYHLAAFHDWYLSALAEV